MLSKVVYNSKIINDRVVNNGVDRVIGWRPWSEQTL